MLAVVCQCIPSKTLEKDSPTPFKPRKYALDHMMNHDLKNLEIPSALEYDVGYEIIFSHIKSPCLLVNSPAFHSITAPVLCKNSSSTFESSGNSSRPNH